MFEGPKQAFRLGATKWCQVVVEGDGCTILGEGLDLGGGGWGGCLNATSGSSLAHPHNDMIYTLPNTLMPHFLGRFDAHGLGTEVGRVSGLAKGDLGTLFLSAGGRLLML